MSNKLPPPPARQPDAGHCEADDNTPYKRPALKLIKALLKPEASLAEVVSDIEAGDYFGKALF